MPHEHHVEHARILIRKLVLAELADTLVAVDRDAARARVELAAEDLRAVPGN